MDGRRDGLVDVLLQRRRRGGGQRRCVEGTDRALAQRREGLVLGATSQHQREALSGRVQHQREGHVAAVPQAKLGVEALEQHAEEVVEVGLGREQLRPARLAAEPPLSDRSPTTCRPKRRLTEARWGSKPPAFAGKLQPRRLIR
eukprot:COSAG01_NODE_8329_length_2827_cov_3.769428_3_plen_144_part_00